VALLLTHIAERVLGRPLLLHPGKAEIIASVLGARIGVAAEPSADADSVLMRRLALVPAANRHIGQPVYGRGGELYRRQGRVGIVPVVGSLINRGMSMGEDSGVTSYESIATQVTAAVRDKSVGMIMLDIDSPGGEAGGMFALAKLIREARQLKPIVALVNDMAASGAYGIASAANEIVVSPTSVSGHIGVVLLHLDQSKELEMMGRKPTLIFAGAHKVDGHQFGPLTDDVRMELQREVDGLYARFVETVALGRPKLSEAQVRATEARPYLGSDAIRAGLADRLGTFDETLADLSARTRAGKQGGVPMMLTDLTETIAMEAHTAAIEAARADGRKAGEAAGAVQGAKIATERIRAILTCPETAGRMPLAIVFALDTEMTPEAAVKALKVSLADVSGTAQTGGPPPPPLAQRGQPPLPAAQPPVPGAANGGAGWDEVVAEVNRANARSNPGRMAAR
jgi:capsid assembly protease